MIMIMVGALLIPAFLGRVDTGLVGSRNYHSILDAQYACDAGAEHAIWSLDEGGLDASIPDAGDYANYNLSETVNGLTANVTVSNAWEVIAWDDFNSAGWTGGGGWLGNWSYAGEALVTADGSPFEGGYHLRLRSSTGVVSRAVDLSKQVKVHLTFWAKLNSAEPGDNVSCRISHGGTDWTTVYYWDDTDSDNAYRFYDLDLTGCGLTDDFYISFKSDMNATGDYFYVDKLQVVWPATDIQIMATEDFESGGWSGGADWLADWTHTSAATVNTTSPYGGSYHLLVLGPDGYAARSVDLSSQSVAHLQFWAKINAFEGQDEAYCLVSSDNSTWHTVYTWTNSDDDDTYHYYDIDITEYGLSDEFWIAFSSGMSADDDYFYVDDISINAIRAYCITATAGDRILKAAVDLMGGLITVLSWWYVV